MFFSKVPCTSGGWGVLGQAFVSGNAVFVLLVMTYDVVVEIEVKVLSELRVFQADVVSEFRVNTDVLSEVGVVAGDEDVLTEV